VARTTLEDFITHAKNTGTSVGQHTEELVTTLTQSLGQTAREAAHAGADAAKTVSNRIAEAASGFLSGLAETIRPKEEKDKPENK
jgi:hypothetical protein